MKCKNIIETTKKSNILRKFPTKDIDILNNIEYEYSDRNKLKKYISKYVECNIDFEILYQNWHKIIKLHPNDSSSLLSYKVRYGEIEGEKIWKEKTEKTKMSIDRLIQKYGEQETKKRLSVYGASLENYIRRHGETLGKIKWDEYCKKRKATYKSRRGTYGKKDLEFYTRRHGLKKATKLLERRRRECKYYGSLEYYIDTHGEEEGRRKIKKDKSRGIDYYVDKYGEEEGKKRHSIKKTNRKRSKFRGYSKWSKEICDAIKEHVPDLLHYAENEKRWCIAENHKSIFTTNKYKKYVKPDLVFKNKIIEFNGDAFHANPKLFESHDTPNPFSDLPSHLIQKIDEEKYNYYTKIGYEVLVIWESDYKKDKDKEIAKCVQFLTS